MKIYLLKPQGHWLFKIGITSNIYARQSNIETTSETKMRRLIAVRVWKAKAFELWLHGKFADRRTTYKGSGKTEYFKLNPLQVCVLWIGLVLLSTAQRIAELAAIGIFLTGLLYIINII